ncbi:MAG: putative glycoside hydrolase [Verrucomicrobiales bacterium]|nr:putative glycoside hydrolase [Verrucomicrobiota bacterium JB025]
MLLAGAPLAEAADSSGRNSHFWVTVKPSAGGKSGSAGDLVLANGYRSVNLDAPELSCKRVDQGGRTVYQVAWTGNQLVGDAGADTLQFNVVSNPGGKEFVLEDVRVNGAGPAAGGLVLESTCKQVKPRKLNGRRAPKNYFEVHASLVLRNPATLAEGANHPFSDLRNGHTFGPTPYAPTNAEKLRSLPEFSWDKVPRGMLIRKSTAYTDAEIKAIADHYDLVVLEKANGAGLGGTMKGMLHTAGRLKEVNPKIRILFYWNSRIYFGHYGIDNTIERHMDEWISKTFFIRDGLKTYVRDNPDFLKWWVGCCEKMISHPQIDGTFVDKAGVPVYMLDALYKATPVNKLVMNNNSAARQRIGYVDGTYREGWSGGHNPETIAETIAIGHETGLNKKMQILRMPVKGAASKREMEDRIDRGLAIYLLYAEPYSYFYWQETVDAKKGKVWQWEASHIDQLNRPLGKPLGPYVRDNMVFTRSFEHCDVYLDLQPEPNDGLGARVMWKNQIGDATVSGAAVSRTDNSYVIRGAGAFGGKSDQFYFLSDAHYGDGGMRASVDSVEKAPDGRAGVMFRESLAADAGMVAVLRDPAGVMQMVCRAGQGGDLVVVGSSKAGGNPHVELIRAGDTFTGFCSAGGGDWTKIGEVTVPMAEKIEMGMAVASKNPSVAAEARISGFQRVETSRISKPDED